MKHSPWKSWLVIPSSLKTSWDEFRNQSSKQKLEKSWDSSEISSLEQNNSIHRSGDNDKIKSKELF